MSDPEWNGITPETAKVLRAILNKLAAPCEKCEEPECCRNYGKRDGKIVGWFECVKADSQ
jgi:hypothetical protein